MNLTHDPVFLCVFTFAVILVGLAKGGFAGLGAVAVPVVALVIDPVKGAAIMLPILLVQDVASVWSFRKDYDGTTLRLMLPGAAVGIFLGWLLASSVSSSVVGGMVGLIAFLFGLNRLLAPHGFSIKASGPMPNWIGTLCGGISGFTSQVAHAGGPPFQIWALGRNSPHLTFIGTSSIFFGTINWIKVPAYLALGQFTPENLRLSLFFLPVAILSTLAGVWLVKRIDPARFFTIINLLLVAVGAELLRVWLF